MSMLQVQQIKECTVVEFKTPSLMNPMELEQIAKALYHLIDEEDRRKIVLDFEQVKFVSSQAIGIVMNTRKKLAALKNAQLVLCGVGPKLSEVLKLSGLLKLLTIKPSQREAVNNITG